MRHSLTWRINPTFAGLCPGIGQIAHLLRTRAPVAARSIATSALPLDLHVLGLSLAFILSQDQTLRCKRNYKIAQNNRKVVIREQVADYTDLFKCIELRELREWSYDHSICSCTTLIVSIFQLLLPSVWRKKIRSSKENLNFNVRASGRKSKHTCFSKASAKVLLFCEPTK